MILIDMPMPNNCLDCPACNEYLTCAIPINGRKWGENDVREFGQGRPEWCPMEEQDAVVRCKDCKYYDSFRQECRNGIDGIMTPNFYCANGERK